MSEWQISTTKSFIPAELGCKCGQCNGSAHMSQEFMERLQDLRDYWKKPLFVTSGYRCPEHPEEKKKTQPGAHGQGRAVDIAWSNWTPSERYAFLLMAMNQGFTGIGIAKSFIHLDDGNNNAARPAIWSY